MFLSPLLVNAQQLAAHAYATPVTCSQRYQNHTLATPLTPFMWLAGTAFTEQACCDLCNDFSSLSQGNCQHWTLNATGCALFQYISNVTSQLEPAAGTTTGTLDSPPPSPPHCPIPHERPGSFCDIKAKHDSCPASCPCHTCAFSDPACGCK